jgi:DNA-binding response OmpR family regulator
MQRSKVLVIDPDPTSSDSIRRLLLAAGYAVTVLDSPFGATSALTREDVASVVLDTDLPGMPGERLIEMWRAHDVHKSLTIIALSADDVRPHGKGPSLGADLTLEKSEVTRWLVPTLNALLKARGRVRAALARCKER